MLKPLLMVAALALLTLPLGLAVAAEQPSLDPPSCVLDLKAESIDGDTIDLASYKGEVLLIVNTASQCGYTPQYKGLEALYRTYKDQGFKVLAFPCNDFGAQEPGDNAQIKDFCTKRYSVTFPVFSKIVVKGANKHPVYQVLTQNGGEIRWNFTKFLIDREGKVVKRFEPGVDPTDEELVKAIESALAQGK
ncbi:Peroxiredoxin [Isosphaera pallida ATCC 43644]|uniref:Glutathione peroxidase n=1 Tax=Isosphaera pallida (strain ATCC 43644 / DSM 9630 / IS1B) TaxID=575540 RepID=E8R1P9_ISOPI|nr:glutathione peroxidase [Isosphaera pallida]ADV63467.1 Peroxiredoxin [Isosphaera pallida ATCC 43644]